jgi:hypothetical protein
MKQILQSLKSGAIELADIPVPAVKKGHLLIKTNKTLISLGTERMLLNFGKAGWVDKARQQPDKVKQVLQKNENRRFDADSKCCLQKAGSTPATRLFKCGNSY